MAVIAFIGFGELASALASALARSGRHEVRVYTRPRSGRAKAALEERLQRALIGRAAAIGDLAPGARAVLSAVPPASAREVAELCAPMLDEGALYVDLASAPVADKEAAAALVVASGAVYVDAAVLGTVAVSGHEVPILASGDGAGAFAELVAPAGLRVEALQGPVGDATRVKLLRSVYMKGRDALIVEMMLAARLHGLDQRVAESIGGPGEQVAFTDLAERVLCSLAVHAGRRADELAAATELMTAAGVQPLAARGGERRLRALAEMGLRAEFDAERPTDARRVLDAIEARSQVPRPS